MTEPALRLEGLTRRFGGVTAVDNVSVSIPKGEIVGLVGPNGAGKTTLVNLVTGFVPKTAGQVFFEGTDVTRLPPHLIARNGIARTFQIVQPFAEMTVLENVMAGALFPEAWHHEGGGRQSAPLPGVRRARPVRGLFRVGTVPRRPRALELAKSLAMEPRLLFLDEVNAGLNSSEIDMSSSSARFRAWASPSSSSSTCCGSCCPW